MESQRRHPLTIPAEAWIALSVCVAGLVSWAIQHVVSKRPAYAAVFAPDWLPIAAAVVAAAGITVWYAGHRLVRLRQTLTWCGLLLMVWLANGLPLDLLRVAGLIPLGVDWPGLATRALALGAAIMLARLALAGPPDPASNHTPCWYGYAAFALALPYPVLRTMWLFGGTIGLMWPGAAGHGLGAWMPSIPWLLAAAMSLLLMSTPRWMPRRVLLFAGWSATAIVAMVGPAACWSLISALVRGGDPGLVGISTWVPGLFYSSWLLWAIAAGAATRSYRLRTAAAKGSAA